jgi:hypothetical protein
MPNRIVRDAVLDSERYLALSHPVERLLFFELILLADDYGLVPLGCGFLARRTTACGGMPQEQSNRLISALADVDLIRVYVAESGSRFAYIPRFGNTPRAKKPKWPMPSDAQSSNEINALREKRVAYAQHLHANAPETETETETETEIPNTLEASPLVLDASHQGRIPKCPTAEIVKAFHIHLPMMPSVVVLNASRKAAISARWREVVTTDKMDLAGGIDWFAWFFGHVAKSRFLTGHSAPRNGRVWKADFDWLMKPQNFAKTVEGNYHKEMA